MENRFGRGLLIVATVLALVGCAPGGTSDEDAKKIAELEKRLADQELDLEAIRAERDAVIPMPGLPELIQDGAPLEEIPEVPMLPIEVKDDDCPMTRWAVLRAETGTNCATYQAEISAYAGRCVAECDEKRIATLAVEIAAARCSQFCSDKGCGQRVTFIPPAKCSGQDCYDSKNDGCDDPDCPLKEYCALLTTDRVWNCFCRDLIPT